MALLTIPLLRNIGLNYIFTYFILNIGVNGHNPITYIQTPFSTIVFQTTDGENAYSPTLSDFCLFRTFLYLKNNTIVKSLTDLGEMVMNYTISQTINSQSGG